jgi:Bacterial regulatory proteins, luxR family
MSNHSGTFGELLSEPADVVRYAYFPSDGFISLLANVDGDATLEKIFGAAHHGGCDRLNKAIARHLAISLHTVKFHVESLFRKLGARTRAEAVAKGLERRRAETIDL